MSALDRYFHGRYLALRPYVLAKLFLVMVALDTWMLMIGHAGRYGVASFNVAHFRWIDLLTPQPSAGLYVGVLLLTGLLALCAALLGTHAGSMALLCLLYTYSWSMSMLDSYQHHYFVSLIMLCMVLFPRVHLREVASNSEPAEARAPGYPLLGVSIGILYVYTAIAKMDAQWCAGHTLQRISKAGKVFAPLLGLCRSFGISDATFWSFVSTSVIPVELLIALGYIVSVRQDASPKRLLTYWALFTQVLALSLHLGAEALGLEIGWFSYYMLVLAIVYLSPAPAVRRIGRALVGPITWVARQFVEPPSTSAAASSKRRNREPWIWTAAATAVLGATAYVIDLPGATGAAAVATVGLWMVVGAAALQKRWEDIRRTALGLGFAGLLMACAIMSSSVRWDYYRYLGGDLQRRGDARAAIAAYEKGERYAPRGSSRRRTIEQLQRKLEREP